MAVAKSVGRLAILAATALLLAQLPVALDALPSSLAASVPTAPLTSGFAGQVADLATGAPVGGAQVYAVQGGGAASTDGQGYYRLAVVPGQYEVGVAAAGYIPMSQVGQRVAPGALTSLDFALLPAEPPPEVQQLLSAQFFAPPPTAPHQEPSPAAGFRPASAPKATYRQFFPFVKTGCTETAPANPPRTVRVLMPSGCVVSMDMEEYLKGVVPAEMPAIWPEEALKAQAVASRSYAASSFRLPDKGANVDTTELTQVYTQRRYATTNAAVEATRGLVATHSGGIIRAFFFADSGGATESNENVWGGIPLPYLRVVDEGLYVPAICGRLPALCWQITLSSPDLAQRLGVNEPLREVAIAERFPSGRVKALRVVTESGQSRTIGGLSDQWRARLGAKSSLLTAIRRQSDGSFTLEGRGWGHGVGLAQWGAWARAQEGADYQSILKAYYKDIAIVPR